MANRRLVYVGAALAVAVLSLGAWAAEAPVSGLQVGEGLPTFNVQDITGLAKGGSVCYV